MKKVFENYHDAAVWIAGWKGGKRRAYYPGDNGKAMYIIRTLDIPPTVGETADKEMWSKTETIRERMGLDPPSNGTRARLLGSVKSEAKSAAARANGAARGGRRRVGEDRKAPRVGYIAKTYTLSPKAVEIIKHNCGGNASAWVENAVRKAAGEQPLRR